MYLYTKYIYYDDDNGGDYDVVDGYGKTWMSS